MARYRGSDETLEREIEVLEAVARTRLRRYVRDLSELDRDLRELKVERARRRAQAAIPATTPVPESEAAES